MTHPGQRLAHASPTLPFLFLSYGTIVSYNVPPYARAGLYKQTAELNNLLGEWRDARGDDGVLREPIARLAFDAGLHKDCPPVVGLDLDVDAATALPDEAFEAWAGRLGSYLRVVEARLFSEGLHTLGRVPDEAGMASYLDAAFGDALPAPARGPGIESVLGLLGAILTWRRTRKRR